VVAVVVTVKFPVTALVPVTSTVEVTPHVAGLVGLAGVVVTAQVRLTLPVNPLDGVTVMVAVSPVVVPATKVRFPLLASVIAGVGGAVIVTPTPVLAVIAPLVPVTVAV
jgi:Zn-dependent protease